MKIPLMNLKLLITILQINNINKNLMINNIINRIIIKVIIIITKIIIFKLLCNLMGLSNNNLVAIKTMVKV